MVCQISELKQSDLSVLRRCEFVLSVSFSNELHKKQHKCQVTAGTPTSLVIAVRINFEIRKGVKVYLSQHELTQ